ncbi:FAD/NAD(P)-binding domain-containing protein [Atractiella rhizophila]|nr:FAD/NAD(P)-binding domain-containing protein [Atractiella rhizophila]
MLSNAKSATANGKQKAEGEPTWMHPSQPLEEKDFSVVVVGAGIGGLCCAIECRLRGFRVICFEQVKQFLRLGDTIGIMPNASVHLYRMGLHPILRPKCGNSRGIEILRYDGKYLVDQRMPKEMDHLFPVHKPIYDAHRGDLHEILVEKAKEVGVDLRQGVKVTEYSDDTPAKPSISFLNPSTGKNETIHADAIVGADGVKSLARQLVLGFEDAPKPSGYAIFRAFFPGDVIRDDPVVGHLVENRVDKRIVWIGPHVHFIGAGINDTKEYSWVMTHPDDADVSEGWLEKGSKDGAIKVIETWDPVLKRLIELTPPDNLLDWKLVYRDPLPNWISPSGRIALMGDAAHPFLPTSIQGASQAIEDAVTISVVLEKVHQSKGKVKVEEGLRVFEMLRYQRVKQTQKTGETTRDKWHKIADWDNIDPESIKLTPMPGLFEHDAHDYAHEKFEETLEQLRKEGYKKPSDRGW